MNKDFEISKLLVLCFIAIAICFGSLCQFQRRLVRLVRLLSVVDPVLQQLDVSRVFSAAPPLRTLPSDTFAVPATADVTVRISHAHYFRLARSGSDVNQ